MQLSNANLEVIRTHPQSTELYLSRFQPTTALACLVSGTYSTGARTITYKSVSSGSYLSVEAGMTLLVGTTLGGRELGKVRVRSATASQIVVAENSNINWANAVYLTVLRYWEIWPVYPRIINDPNNVENVIFYKDYDIVYSNQNTALGAFPCAGTHRAGFVGDSFYFTASGTSHLIGSALTYDWAFEGGTVTGSTSANPGYITYNTPGHYVTRLVVTGANGSVDITYRYVSIYNNPVNSSSNNPIRNWEMSSLSGSRGEGGYNSSIKIIDESVPSLFDGDVFVLFSENYYGSSKVNLGGNSENNGSIFFVGHITNNSIEYDYSKSAVNFQVSSITDIMKLSEGFAVSVQSINTPTKWFELLDMDGRRAIYHYLKWHSTVLFTTDVEFKGTDQKIQFFDSDRSSIFDAIDNYMRGTLLGNVTSDLQGKIWLEVGVSMSSNPTGTYVTEMSITKRDWINSPVIQERLTPTTSFIELGGIAYSGSVTGTFSALISSAPGETPNVRGNVTNQQGLALSSQSQLNSIAGNVFADKNSIYPTIDVDLAGNFRNFDIAPIMAVDINLATTDTNRGISINAPYLVNSLSWAYSSDSKMLLPSVGLVALVNGVNGSTVTIPDVPEGGGFSNFGGGGLFNYNPGALPPFLSTIGARRSWTGICIVTGTSALSATYNFLNYAYSSGDTTLISSPNNGVTYPSPTVPGIYIVTLYVRTAPITYTYATVQLGFSSHALQGLQSDMYINTGGTEDFVNLSAVQEIFAGESITSSFGFLKPDATAGNPIIARMSVVKLD